MKTIKFRGKRVDNGEWVYGDLYQEKKPFKDELNQVMIVEHRPDLCLVSGAPDNNQWWREISPETVGQFTGFKDVVDIDIYEGGQLKAHGTHTFTVFWNANKGQWYVSFTDLDDNIIEPLVDCIAECDENYGGVKVIGNIHEK